VGGRVLERFSPQKNSKKIQRTASDIHIKHQSSLFFVAEKKIKINK
jgi:hypothetical protein